MITARNSLPTRSVTPSGSIQQRELIDRFSFASYYEAKQHIEKYMHWYNHVRRHGVLKGLTPVRKWEQGWALLALSGPDSEGLSVESAPYSLDQASERTILA